MYILWNVVSFRSFVLLHPSIQASCVKQASKHPSITPRAQAGQINYSLKSFPERYIEKYQSSKHSIPSHMYLYREVEVGDLHSLTDRFSSYDTGSSWG